MIREYQLSDQESIEKWWDLENIATFVERPTAMWSQYVTLDANVICKLDEKQKEIRGVVQFDLENEQAYLAVVTNPKYRNIGVGKNLVSVVVPELRKRGVTKLTAFVEPENNLGQALASSMSMVVKGKDDEGFIKYQKAI